MTEPEHSPYLAFSFLLLMLLAGSLAIQTLGYAMGVSLARCAILDALPFCLWLTYGYCFHLTRRHVAVALLLTLLLMLLGLISAHLLDFTPDGLGYHQPSAWAIMGGWNPFGPSAVMLWQQIYPSGVWTMEASLAFWHGSPEDTKMLQIWLLFISLPILFSGISSCKGPLNGIQTALVILMTFCTFVAAQVLTHYVDMSVYLAGLAFMGGFLLYGRTRRRNVTASLIMSASLAIVVNAKLSGIYHAFMLCAAAVIFLWMSKRRLPWKMACMLLAAGLISLLVIGYRPYVTSFIAYGPSLFPDSTEAFSGAQRPSSFDALSPFARFAYSFFSVDGGGPHEPAQLKWPWTVSALEWKFAGDPDPRTGGYGPLFALGFLTSLAVFLYALVRRMRIDKALVAAAAVCLLSSAAFPQGWWARYVPFAYAAPFLLLLSLPLKREDPPELPKSDNDKIMRAGMIIAVVIFAANSAMALSAGFTLFYRNQKHFMEVAQMLRGQPRGSVYLLPPVANYRKYNDTHMPLQRRLKEQGVDTDIRVDAPCPRQAEMYNGFAVCY